MIELKNVSKIYHTETIETTAINDISLKINKGDFLSITGPSGSGKSTLLNLIGLLDSPTSGDIIVNKENIKGLKDKKLSKLRNKTIGFIFQSYHLIDDLNVIENVELPLIYRKISKKKRKEMAELALEKVGLTNRKKHFPRQLSGGQKQRVAIARAIVGNPAIILADEPTGNLDSKMGDKIMGLLIKLNKIYKTTIILVTHNLSLTTRIERNIIIKDGNLIN